MIFFILCLIVSASSPKWGQLHTQKGWTLYKNVENEFVNVEVWTKKIEGIPCFVGKTTSVVDVSILLGVSRDIEGSMTCSTAGLQESITLLNKGKEMDYYQRISFPLVSHRHCFLRGRTERRKEETLFYWDRQENGRPHVEFYSKTLKRHPSAVEPPTNVGGWSFVDTGSEVVVSYYCCTHPGGMVSQKFQAIGTSQTLPNNLRDLIIEGRKRAN